MCSCVLHREGAIDERNIVAVEEPLCDMGGLVRVGGELGIGGTVDAMESHFAVVVVAERSTVDAQAERRHEGGFEPRWYIQCEEETTRFLSTL